MHWNPKTNRPGAIPHGSLRRRARLSATAAVVVSTVLIALGSSVEAARSGSDVGTVVPARLLDTRSNGSTIDGVSLGAGKVGAGGVARVQVAGRGGVPGDARGAELNVTAIQAEGGGFATLYPCTATPPTASSLNFQPGVTIANATTVALSSTGEVCVFSSATAHFALDVVAFVPAGSDVGTVVPARLLDTRPNGTTIDGNFDRGGKVGASRTLRVQIAGRGGVPADATGVELNITAIQAEAGGFATLYPCTSTPPTASSLNFQEGVTIANATTVALNTSGEVCIFTSARAHFVLDALAAIAIPGVALESTLITESRCSIDAFQTILGNTYEDVLSCRSSFTEPVADFNLGTRYTTFAGFVGVTDQSTASRLTRITLTLDGVQVFEQDIRLGDQIPIELDVTGGLRLRFEARSLTGDGSPVIVFSGRFDSGKSAAEIIGPRPTPAASRPLESALITESRCSIAPFEQVLGVIYTDVLSCRSSFTEPVADFNLGTRTSRFIGFVAVTDESTASRVSRVTLEVDGVEVFRRDIRLGDRIPIDLDVSGGLRLRFQVTSLAGSGSPTIVLTGDLLP